MEPKDLPLPRRIGQFLMNFVLEGMLRLALALPYERRVPLAGWLVSRIVAPLAGWRRRIRTNLAHAWPDLPGDEVERLVRAVPDNAGRALIEMYSGDDLKARVRQVTPEGPGWAVVKEAHAEGRPIFFLSGHFGNYDAARSLVAMEFGEIGALYRPLNNVYFNRHYVEAMTTVARPLFPRGRRGLAEMMKYVRKGRFVAILNDQHFGHGAPLTFFGRTAYTALSIPEIAMKLDALIVPAYAIRQPDGLSFRVVFEEPIPHTSPEEVGQALNDSLERRVRDNPGQWLWLHRRWKPGPAGPDARTG